MAAERFYKKHKSLILQAVATAGITAGSTWLVHETYYNNQQDQTIAEVPVSTQTANIVPERPRVDSVNLITNGDFEVSVPIEVDFSGNTFRNTVPVNWELAPQEFDYISLEKDKDGSNFLSLQVYKTPDGRLLIPYVSFGETLKIDPDTNYRLSFKGKSQVINSQPFNPPTLAPAVQFKFMDESGKLIKTERIIAIPNRENVWQDFEYSLGLNTPNEFPHNAAGLKIELLGAFKTDDHIGDKVSFDNFEFIPWTGPMNTPKQKA